MTLHQNSRDSPRAKEKEFSNESSVSVLTVLVRVLDHAIASVPAAKYFWGVIAASATVGIVSLINGLNRVTFIALVAAFIAVLIFYTFSRIGKSSDVLVKLVGYALIIISGLAFIFIIVTSAWLTLTCAPPLLAYIYGVSDFCQKSGAPHAADVEQHKATALYRAAVRRNGALIGIDQIKEDEARHLDQFYEFTTVGNDARTVEVRSKNSFGQCALHGIESATSNRFSGSALWLERVQ